MEKGCVPQRLGLCIRGTTDSEGKGLAGGGARGLRLGGLEQVTYPSESSL